MCAQGACVSRWRTRRSIRCASFSPGTHARAAPYDEQGWGSWPVIGSRTATTAASLGAADAADAVAKASALGMKAGSLVHLDTEQRAVAIVG
ncbi:glycoside hydrolase domain-containing protein [Streptomyces flaveolus]|uniref:glycoside hydrolase domain-containing protein n=1 Tax=Streptomyces flaveolus TaxID=67297 RepID=UPI003F5658DB